MGSPYQAHDHQSGSTDKGIASSDSLNVGSHLQQSQTGVQPSSQVVPYLWSRVWHTPSQKNRTRSTGIEALLDQYQNKSLRAVAGAFRATPINVLETETFTPPLNVYLNSHLIASRTRLTDSGLEKIIERQCERFK